MELCARLTARRPDLLSTLYAFTALITAFMLGWVLLVSINFGYGMWHDLIGIDDNIERFGPENRYREGFADTDRAQRIALFGQIVDSVIQRGEGLEAITYTTPRSPQGIPLLRDAEIVHLQDVANLIAHWHRFGGITALVWLLLSAVLWYRRRTLAPLSGIAFGYGALALVLGLALTIFGFEKVFYQLHIWVFPKDHPWFFYYQDSLMSTMMKAPDLFMYIALSWAAIAIPGFCGLYLGASRLLKQRP